MEISTLPAIYRAALPLRDCIAGWRAVFCSAREYPQRLERVSAGASGWMVIHAGKAANDCVIGNGTIWVVVPEDWRNISQSSA